MAAKTVRRRTVKDDHVLELVKANPLHARCSCGWYHKAETRGLTEAQAIIHVQRWHRWHVKFEQRSGAR